MWLQLGSSNDTVTNLSLKDPRIFQFRLRKALAVGRLCCPEFKFWSSSTNLVTKLYLQPSPSPVGLQHVSCDPSNCCDVLGVELVLTDRAVQNSRAGVLGWPGHVGAYIEVLYHVECKYVYLYIYIYISLET